MKDMQETGQGVYLIREVWAREVGFHPSSLFIMAIPESLEDASREEVAGWVLSFSFNHNAWCGVDWHTLFDLICRDRIICPNQHACSVGRTIMQMVNDDLLVIPGQRNGWLSFFNCLSIKVVCPTPLLVLRIWANRHEVKERSTILGKAKP